MVPIASRIVPDTCQGSVHVWVDEQLLSGWMDRWVDAWMGEWMDGWMSEWMYGWMNEWMDELMHGWMVSG